MERLEGEAQGDPIVHGTRFFRAGPIQGEQYVPFGIMAPLPWLALE